MEERDVGLLRKRVLIYLLAVFSVTWIYEFAILYPAWKEIRSIAALPIAAVMFFPALSVLFTRLVTREGFGDSYIDPRFRRGKRRFYLAAWFLPSVLTLIGVCIYFLVFKDNFSPDMEYYVGVLKDQGADYAPEVAERMVISTSVAGFFLAPLLNILTCFGEEWGWRAYLLPKLRSLFGLKKAMIASGVIWGLWHLPITIMGHNYGLSYTGYPVTGILAMCVFCTVIGVFFAWLFVRTGSVFPSVLAHGALNGFASFGIYFTRDGGNPFIGPSVTGILSGLPFIICAVIAWRLLSKDETQAEELPEKRGITARGEGGPQRRETQEGR